MSGRANVTNFGDRPTMPRWDVDCNDVLAVRLALMGLEYTAEWIDLALRGFTIKLCVDAAGGIMHRANYMRVAYTYARRSIPMRARVFSMAVQTSSRVDQESILGGAKWALRGQNIRLRLDEYAGQLGEERVLAFVWDGPPPEVVRLRFQIESLSFLLCDVGRAFAAAAPDSAEAQRTLRVLAAAERTQGVDPNSVPRAARELIHAKFVAGEPPPAAAPADELPPPPAYDAEDDDYLVVCFLCQAAATAGAYAACKKRVCDACPVRWAAKNAGCPFCRGTDCVFAADAAPPPSSDLHTVVEQSIADNSHH